MTVASGKGEVVADEGRKMPVAVFCECQSLEFGRGELGRREGGWNYCFGFEALD